MKTFYANLSVNKALGGLRQRASDGEVTEADIVRGFENLIQNAEALSQKSNHTHGLVFDELFDEDNNVVYKDAKLFLQGSARTASGDVVVFALPGLAIVLRIVD